MINWWKWFCYWQFGRGNRVFVLVTREWIAERDVTLISIFRHEPWKLFIFLAANCFLFLFFFILLFFCLFPLFGPIVFWDFFFFFPWVLLYFKLYLDQKMIHNFYLLCVGQHIFKNKVGFSYINMNSIIFMNINIGNGILSSNTHCHTFLQS